MGKRNQRILPAAFKSDLPALAGKEVHVFHLDGTTFSGILFLADQQHVEIRDKGRFWYNRKKKTHSIPLSEIREVIHDYVTDW